MNRYSTLTLSSIRNRLSYSKILRSYRCRELNKRPSKSDLIGRGPFAGRAFRLLSKVCPDSQPPGRRAGSASVCCREIGSSGPEGRYTPVRSRGVKKPSRVLWRRNPIWRTHQRSRSVGRSTTGQWVPEKRRALSNTEWPRRRGAGGQWSVVGLLAVEWKNRWRQPLRAWLLRHEMRD